MLKYILVFLCFPTYATEISFYDSRVNKKTSWVLVDDCAVEIPRSKVKDVCFVLKKVNDFCHLELPLDKCGHE